MGGREWEQKFPGLRKGEREGCSVSISNTECLDLNAVGGFLSGNVSYVLRICPELQLLDGPFAGTPKQKGADLGCS